MDIKIILQGRHDGEPVHAEIADATYTLDDSDLKYWPGYQAVWMLDAETGGRTTVDLCDCIRDDDQQSFAELYDAEIDAAIVAAFTTNLGETDAPDVDLNDPELPY